MRVPIRRSQLNRRFDDNDDFLTAAAIRRLQADLSDLEKVQRPRALEDLTRAREMGDLSENAAYTEAKARLGRIDGRMFGIRERLKRAVLIEPGASDDGKAKIGSTVTVETGGGERTYEITGTQETNPGRGRISHRSPLGQALIGRRIGDTVTVPAPNGPITYRVTRIA